MAQSRPSELERTLDLASIVSHLAACKSLAQQSDTPSDSSIIPVLESQLLHADRLIQEIIGQARANLTTLDKEVFATLEKKYEPIVKILEGCAAIIKQKAKDITERAPSTPNELVQRFQTLSTDIIKMSDLIRNAGKMRPTDTYTENSLYELTTALGGIYVRFSQDYLPTMGGQLSGGAFTESKGNCAGIVWEWAKQSAEKGTPQYPISCTISVLEYQNNQHTLFATQVENAMGVMVNAKDLVVMIDKEIVPNFPYVASIMHAHANTGHAIGIRKHVDCIEIVDPNFGYFFFKDATAAGTWLASLLHFYQSLDFPALELVVGQYAATKGPFPENKYVDMAELEKAAVRRYTAAGHTQLMMNFWRQLSRVIEYANQKHLPNLVDIVLDTMRYTYKHFDQAERNALIRYLESCLTSTDDNEKSETTHSTKFMSSKGGKLFLERIRKHAAYKAKIKKLIDEFKDVPLHNRDVPAETLAFIEEYKKLEENYLKVANEAKAAKETLVQQLAALRATWAAPEELEALNKSIEEKDRIMTVNTNLRLNLRQRNMDAKLLASHQGLLRETYSHEVAAKEMQEVTNKLSILYKMLDKLNASLTTQCKEASAACPERSVVVESRLTQAGINIGVYKALFLDETDLTAVVHKLSFEAKVKASKAALLQVKALQQAVTDNQSDKCLDNVFIQLGEIAPGLEQQKTEIAALVNSHREDKFKALFGVLSLTPTSAFEPLFDILTKETSQANEDVQRIAKALLTRFLNLRDLIVQCVNPLQAKTDVFEAQLLAECRAVIPAVKSLDEVTGDALRLAVINHLAFANKPKQFLALFESVVERLNKEVNQENRRYLKSLIKKATVVIANYHKGRYDDHVNPTEFCLRNMLIAMTLMSEASRDQVFPAHLLKDVNAEVIEKVLRKRLTEERNAFESASDSSEEENAAPLLPPTNAELTLEEVSASLATTTSVEPDSSSIQQDKVTVEQIAPAPVIVMETPSFWTRHPALKWSLIGLGVTALLAGSIVATGAIVLTAGIGIAAAIGLCAIGFSLLATVAVIAEAFAGKKVEQGLEAIKPTVYHPLLAPIVAPAPGKPVSGATSYSAGFFAGSRNVTEAPVSSQSSHLPASPPQVPSPTSP